ncbi:MAG: glycosyltransferase family 4 protein [Anaerolineales bacterium]|nr:glycosyltransferase family 4 protein [Anaerolineales bacterium]
MVKIGFIIEQALGHITHGQNLQQNVAADPTIEAYWGLPTWEAGGLAGLIPNWTFKAGLQARQQIAAMQRQTQLDVLFFHTQVTAVLAQSWLKRIPGIVSLDATPRQYDSLGEFYAHKPGPAWLENWKWRLNRDCLAAAQHIVTWSAWAKEGVVGEYEVPPDKVTVIPPGVNVDAWTRPEPRHPDDGPVKILFVGGNLERKGGLLLLEAWRSLRQTAVPTLELHLVTRDTVAAEPGLFVYKDMQPNSDPLKQLYYAADIFCLPTYGDCLPMVLSEAGAAGLPVVSTAVAAIPEIVIEGETGFLVPTGDVSALAHALRQLVEDPEMRLRLGETAVTQIRRTFDAAANARQLLDLLKETSRAHAAPQVTA